MSSMPADFNRLKKLLESELWSEVEEGVQEVRELGLDAIEGLSSYLDGRLQVLAGHENWRVRKEVAGLLGDFDRPRLLAVLMADSDHRVILVAQQSSCTWDEHHKRQAATERRNSRFEQRLSVLKKRHGDEVAREVHALAIEFLGVVAERVGHDLSGLVSTLRRVELVLKKHVNESQLGTRDWERSVGSLPRVAHFLQSFAEDFREFVAPPNPARDFVRVDEIVKSAVFEADASARSEGPRPTIYQEVGSSLRAVLPVGAVTRCIANLVKNALEATPASGSIWIRAWADGGDLRIRVADTGSGMPDDLKARCFEPFRSTKRSSGAKPSGLGLAIVQRKIEEHMGGQIRLESELGKGTKFTLEIPRVVQE